MNCLQELSSAFEIRKRNDGESFVCLKDDSPQWMIDLFREVHGTEMLPDDFKYQVIAAAVEFLAEETNDIDDLKDFETHEFCDSMVDVYNSDLIRWMGSHVDRLGYVNRAKEEGLVGDDATIETQMMSGQYLEIQEIVSSLINELCKAEMTPEWRR